MNNNDNEIKFVKGRSNDSEVIVDFFKKGRYYDAFYSLKRLEKCEQIKFLPLVAETYAKLKRSDYEANALLKLLMNNDTMKEGLFDKRVIALRLSEYYSYKGEKLQKLSLAFDDEKTKVSARNLKSKILAENLIKFPSKENEKNKGGALKLLSDDCKIYKKSNLSVEYGSYICGRATSLALAGKYDQAIAVLKKIKKEDLNYLDSRNIMTAVYVDSNRLLEASEVAIEIIKERPDEFIALFAINMALNLSINSDKIIQALMEIEGKTGAQCAVLRANAFGSNGEFQKAIDILNMLDEADSYGIDVLRVKAICYAGLEDRESQEAILKQIVTIYPKDLRARYVLSKIGTQQNINAQALGLDNTSEFLADEFKNFYENKLFNLESQKLSYEEAEYYYELCLKFGSNGIISTCTECYLKCKNYLDIIYDALIDINLDDFKKMIIVEQMILSGLDGECFSLINGMMKKLNLSSLKFLISQFKENMLDSFLQAGEEKEELVLLIDNTYAKAFALSLLLDIDGTETSSRVGALLLYFIMHKSEEFSEILKIMRSPKILAFSACIIMNPQLAKNSKLKKYLGLKNAEIDEIIKILHQTGFRN